MNQKRKIPIIHTVLILGLSVSFALILGLVIFNFVVIDKIDEVGQVLTMIQDKSHFKKLKQEFASNMIKTFKEKKQILITIQTLGFILLFLIPMRLILLLIGLYPPPIGSKFSFLRRTHMEMASVFKAGTSTSDELPEVSGEVKKSTAEAKPLDSSNVISEGQNLDMSTQLGA